MRSRRALARKVEAVTHTIQWLASQRVAQVTHVIILTDSVNLLLKLESGMGCPDWHTAMHSLWLQRLLWIYCPGHAGVCGNERAERLASTADMTSGLQLGRAEVLRGLRNFLNRPYWPFRALRCHPAVTETGAAWRGRGASSFGELCEHGQARASQH